MEASSGIVPGNDEDKDLVEYDGNIDAWDVLVNHRLLRRLIDS